MQTYDEKVTIDDEEMSLSATMNDDGSVSCYLIDRFSARHYAQMSPQEVTVFYKAVRDKDVLVYCVEKSKELISTYLENIVREAKDKPRKDRRIGALDN